MGNEFVNELGEGIAEAVEGTKGNILVKVGIAVGAVVVAGVGALAYKKHKDNKTKKDVTKCKFKVVGKDGEEPEEGDAEVTDDEE